MMARSSWNKKIAVLLSLWVLVLTAGVSFHYHDHHNRIHSVIAAQSEGACESCTFKQNFSPKISVFSQNFRLDSWGVTPVIFKAAVSTRDILRLYAFNKAPPSRI